MLHAAYGQRVTALAKLSRGRYRARMKDIEPTASRHDHPYDGLTPDIIVAAVDQIGLRTDGRLLPLNSYENRVYQVGIEDDTPVIAKFYRPERWSTDAILEEHAFAAELVAAEVPVVAPMNRDGRTLFEHANFRFAVFPRQGGRWPELATEKDREWMGRFLGRIHAVGRRWQFQYRTELSIELLGEQPRAWLLDHDWIPEHLLPAYESVSEQLLDAIYTQFEALDEVTTLRLHGDCHPGNVLWTDDGPHFVDLDDCLTGPAIQDLWMLLSGNRREMGVQLGQLLQGYAQFVDFDYGELRLVESLRSLRMIHYAGWLARRWDDPAFPRAFPWFAETRYWEQHVLNLREQLSAMEEGPLELSQ
jgi:Ser/Thr protein kinase RdoA (MazF antagonist)